MHFNRIRHLLVAMAAVFAFGAVMSASASAHEFFVQKCVKVAAGTGKYNENTCKVLGGTKVWEWKFEKLVGAETEDLTDSSGISLLESEVGGVKVIIECNEDISSGFLEAAGATKGTIKFGGPPPAGCKLFEIKAGEKKLLACKVVTPIEFEFRDLLINSKGIVGAEDEFFPTAANKKLFVSIVIEGCALEGTYKAETTEEGKGIYCALPEGWVAKWFHEIVCTSTGDERLKFGTAKASYTSTDTVRISSGNEWYIE